MAETLEIILAELAVKDLSTKDLKKIDKALSKVKKNIKSTEKDAKGLSKVFGRFKSPGLQRAGRGVKRAGRGVGRAGGVLTGGFGGIPIIGGAIMAAMGAMSATRSRFIAGVSLERELIELSNNFKSAFGDKARNVLSFVAREGSFFREDDFRMGFTALRDAGIDPDSIKNNVTKLTKFAKSQGFTTITEGLQALVSGQIKGGRGLGVEDIKGIQAYAPFLKDVASADIAFQGIMQILERAGTRLDKFADATTSNTAAIKRQSNLVTDMNQKTTKLGRSFTGAERIFIETEQNARLTNKAAATIADKTSGLVSSLMGFVPDVIEGAEAAFTAVGEAAGGLWDIVTGAGTRRNLEQARRRQIENPDPDSRPAPRMPTTGGSTTGININVNINAPSKQAGSLAAIEIRKVLNQLAKTTFRHHTGLNLTG